MGLASALSTALTGLSAAETTIDVVGNNLANSNTVGYKASQASFATQFLQTLALGSGPTDGSGGTNPRQIGLGTMVADITPDFGQGTIEISSNPTDMAIQGDGFFIVQGAEGDQLYTRNGIFKMNSENQLVTITGHRLLGYGIDDNFQIQRTVLTPISIPLGATAVAQSTGNAYLEGTLSPTGDLADQAAIIQTSILSDAKYEDPEGQAKVSYASGPGWAADPAEVNGGGLNAGDVVEYRLVFADENAPEGFQESNYSELRTITVQNNNSSVFLDNIPTTTSLPADMTGNPYTHVRIYRKDSTSPGYRFAGQIPVTAGTPQFTDSVAVGGYAANPVMDETRITGDFTYYVTYGNTENPDEGLVSRPTELSSSINTNTGRVLLYNLPRNPTDTEWQYRHIWRRDNATSDSNWHLVETLHDVNSDITLVDTRPNTGPGGVFNEPVLDLDGPRIQTNTYLVDVLRRDGGSYEQVFQAGTLDFAGRKGGRTLSTKQFEVTSESTVQDLIDFMEDALGIQKPMGIAAEQDIPVDSGSGREPGGFVENGRINLVANNGVANALDIGLSAMLIKTGSSVANIDLPWATVQNAVGESAVTDFLAYDSLGIPLRVRLTAVLEKRDSTSTTYRWFADSPDNDPLTGAGISVGTGLISFDGEGNFVSATESTISIDRRHVSSASPLEFELDFSQISGLAADRSTLSVSRQDGSAPGVLTSFIVGEDGTIRGVFSNGVTRDLGQLRLARFANPSGLEQRGQNLFAEGVNSGLPVQGDPGQQGIGTIISGATELSNTDIGSSLIDLILASTMYRGNTRVITTSQQMLDELLALRR